MKHGPRQSSPNLFPQSSHRTAQGEFPISKDGLSQVASLAEDHQHSHAPVLNNLNTLTTDFESYGLQGIHPRSKLSASMWRFILIAGDNFLLLVLLGLLLILPQSSYRNLGIIDYASGPWNLKLVWVSLALLSWSIAANIIRCQELLNSSNRLRSPLYTLFALALMCILWIGFSYPFIASDVFPFTRGLLFFFVLAVPLFSLWRILLAELINLPRFRRQAVIVGVNTAGETIAQEIREAKCPIANVLGYVSEFSEERGQKDGLPILGGRSLLRHLLASGVLDMIIMAIDYKVSPELLQDAIEAVQWGVSVVPMSMVYEYTSGKIPVEHVGDQWYMALPIERHGSLLYICWRKVMDIAFGLIGSLLLLVILPIVGLLIYLDSPGPIFYKQERMGYQGKKFYMLKFRSMQTDAENTGSAVWAAKTDSRVTRIGKFMRTTHLDELPQVLNILRSEMSLIGPRPEREEFVRHLEKRIPFYCCRLSVKPGLTGWAQVKCHYASSDGEAMIKLQYDLYYIKHQAFTLDIFIILKTVVEVLLCQGR
ncbi:MAG TPA: sugar transferase [Ktedonobacteraceae bacterium]|nr:sugar transferase [Ktedonobacteraceae bacterium]